MRINCLKSFGFTDDAQKSLKHVECTLAVERDGVLGVREISKYVRKKKADEPRKRSGTLDPSKPEASLPALPENNKGNEGDTSYKSS